MNKWVRKLKNSTINPPIIKKTEIKQQDREVLALYAKHLSPNQISQYLSEIGIHNMKSHKVRSTILNYKSRIDLINSKFDEIAAKSISIIEMDETFKGMHYVILVVMDSITGYIYLIERIIHKNEACIVQALSPLTKMLRKVKVVLTDGAVYFPKIIRDLFPDAIHQICLVHVMRSLRKELAEIKKPYLKNLKKCKEIRDKLSLDEQKLKKKRLNLKKLKQQLKYHQSMRDEYRLCNNIKKNQKGIRKKHPFLKDNYKKINHISASVRSLEKTIKSLIERYNVNIDLLNMNDGPLMQSWNKFMKECRLLHEFYDLFFLHEKKYLNKKRLFISKLCKQKKNSIRDKMRELLEKVPSLDVINRKEQFFQLKRNFQNTNGIESFNSRFRPLLESLKNAAISRLTQIRFDLFRLYINTTLPYNPTRMQCAPIECYGYDLRGRNTFDLILNGLPPGTQNLKILPFKVIELIERKLIKSHPISCYG